MRTLLLNGSPKPNPKASNTQYLAEAFVRDMASPPEIRRIYGSDMEDLAGYAAGFDTVLLFFPLYIHGMPGHVADFLTRLRPAGDGQRLGVMIQAGFPETQQEQYILPYLERLAQRLGYVYLGAVCKGECAAVCEFPQGFQKTVDMFNRLGKAFDKTGAFDPSIVTEIAQPYQLSRKQVKLLNVLGALGLSNMFWNRAMKQHGCFDKRLDRPFL